jgi:Glycolipid 2-alpha-mannosyltransferase
MILLDILYSVSYQYPVIVFVEEDLNNAGHRRTIRSFTGPDIATQSRLFIQVVRFQIPDFVARPVPLRAGNGKPIGYRHMCRFHARTVYEQPTIGFTYADGRPVIEYAWRLDDDSFLFRPINYDVFAFMRDRQLLYGYVLVRAKQSSCGNKMVLK